MPRFLSLAAPLLGCLAGFAASPAQAQYLYVGSDNARDFSTPGEATMSAAGTTASGNYSFVDADSQTTGFVEAATFNTSRLTITGGTFEYLDAEGASVIDLIGTNFAESSNLVSTPYGDNFQTLSGTLEGSASPFTAYYYAPGTGTLEFNGIPAVPGAAPIPEASPAVTLTLLLLGAACLTARGGGRGKAGERQQKKQNQGTPHAAVIPACG